MNFKILACSLLLVFSFLSVIPIKVVRASVIFSDGFESGNFSAWTSTFGSPTVETLHPYRGIYNEKASSAGGAAYTIVAEKTLTSATSYYARAYVQWVNLPSSSGTGFECVIFANGLVGSGTELGKAIIWNNGSNTYWALRIRIGGTINTNYLSNMTVASGTWYSVEIYLKISTSAGAATLWIDGNQAISKNGLNTGSSYINNFELGIETVRGTTQGNTVYSDSAVVADSYIGPEPPMGQTIYTLTTNVTPVGSGTVTHNNTGPYLYGDNVKLTAVPTAGWAFSFWSGNLTGSANPAVVTMTGNESITANFVQLQHVYELTTNVAPAGGGLVTRNNTGPLYYNGEEVQLMAVPNAGWSFYNWTGDLSGNTNPAVITINYNKTVAANFVQGQSFTIIALPDTQYYSSTFPWIFDNQTQWIVNNVRGMNIVFVTHEGDIVDSYNKTYQWQNANESMSRLDGHVPWGVLPGNHDLAGGFNGFPENPGNATYYNKYFGYSRFSRYSWYGGAYQGNNNTNNYELFSEGKDDYLIFHLQMEPSNDVLMWANNTIANYPNRRVIVTTHDYLWNGSRDANGKNIWNGFIKPHADQIFLVLSGHVGPPVESRRTDVVNGHIVYQCEADFQYLVNGGDGWLRIYQFSPAENKIYVKTYSPYINLFNTTSDSQFTLNYNMTHPSYTLTTNITPAGSGTVTRNNTGPLYYYGDKVQLTAIPTTGWTFSSWSGDLSGSANQTVVTMNGNKTVRANFIQLNYTLWVSISPMGSGSVSPNKTSPYHYSDKVKLTATPIVGWRFSNWSGNLTGSINPAVLTINGNESVTAAFTQLVYSLTVNASSFGSGSVTLNNSGPYYYGDKVQLAAVPVNGWIFSNWSGDLTGSINPAVIVINGNKTVTANFIQLHYTLWVTISSTGSGSVILNHTGPYLWDDKVQLTATPTAGWAFSSWSGDLSGSVNPVVIIMNGNKTVTATFMQLRYTLNVTSIERGSVSRNNTGPYYHYGDKVQLTSIPNAGWMFTSWSGNLTGSANPAVITITGNESVTATFTKLQYTLTVKVSPYGNGSVTLNNTGPYYYGDQVQLNATPTSGWIFLNWTGDLVGSANPSVIIMNGNKTVSAVFTYHDVAVIGITPSSKWIYGGNTLDISVTVKNKGLNTETFNVTLFGNATSITTRILTNLAPNSTATINFIWNTSAYAYGLYTITAKATPVSGETNMFDNTLIYNGVTLRIPGDINGDTRVDASDLLILSKAYGSTPGALNWNQNCDINQDNKVDAADLFILSKNYGNTIQKTQNISHQNVQLYAALLPLTALPAFMLLSSGGCHLKTKGKSVRNSSKKRAERTQLQVNS